MGSGSVRHPVNHCQHLLIIRESYYNIIYEFWLRDWKLPAIICNLNETKIAYVNRNINYFFIDLMKQSVPSTKMG